MNVITEAKCNHANVLSQFDGSRCQDCGAFRTDSQWGFASCQWFDSRGHAEHYSKTGRLPETYGQTYAELSADFAALSKEFSDRMAELDRTRQYVDMYHRRAEDAEKRLSALESILQSAGDIGGYPLVDGGIEVGVSTKGVEYVGPTLRDALDAFFAANAEAKESTP